MAEGVGGGRVTLPNQTTCPCDVDEKVVAAAERLREELRKAVDGNYYSHGWYAYMARWDVEAIVDFVLGPLAEKEPEKVAFTAVESAFRDGVHVAGGYVTGTGQVITRVHDPADCAGRGCVIHNPSEHHMKDWPTNWRSGGWLDIKPPHMERVCEHGVGHPDPDDTAFHGPDVIGVHGCDGCCHKEET